MKIAFLNYYQDSTHRGLEAHITELATALGKHHQILIAPSPASTNQPLFTLSLLRRFFLDTNSLKIALYSIKQLKSLERFNPQIIFATNGGWQSLIFRLYSSVTNKKLIFVGHSGPGWDDRWNLLCHPDVFVCLTQSQLDWAKKATVWKNQKFARIPNGVNLAKFSPQGKKAKLDLPKPIICIAAAPQPSKNIDKTISAVDSLGKGSLLILGKGHLNIPAHKMPDYYRACNLFTLCSDKSEAFGIVYLEAMACGLPIVATDDASRREIVGKAGVFVKDPADTAEYAAAIKAALAKKWGNLPRLQASKFSWDKIAKRYQKLFLSL